MGRLPATALREPRSSVRQTATPRGGWRGAARETLTEQAYRLIEEQIVTLRLKPGDVLSEQMLSAMFKIGRTPIREALQRLAREGLITILPRKGVLVSDINPRNQLLVLEVRREIERLLSRAGLNGRTRTSANNCWRSRRAWTALPRPMTTSPSCGSTASSIAC
jgi:DNA-binding transcriptional regulator YhcF (GntR family)